jgi:hypothetical protein
VVNRTGPGGVGDCAILRKERRPVAARSSQQQPVAACGSRQAAAGRRAGSQWATWGAAGGILGAGGVNGVEGEKQRGVGRVGGSLA